MNFNTATSEPLFTIEETNESPYPNVPLLQKLTDAGIGEDSIDNALTFVSRTLPRVVKSEEITWGDLLNNPGIGGWITSYSVYGPMGEEGESIFTHIGSRHALEGLFNTQEEYWKSMERKLHVRAEYKEEFDRINQITIKMVETSNASSAIYREEFFEGMIDMFLLLKTYKTKN